MSRTVAIAAFVKTPGVSPVKTRLAHGLGSESASRFYELSVEAVRSVLVKVAKQSAGRAIEFTPYWAVAEDEALESSTWRDLACISQGTGGLGQRLSHVYESLLGKYAGVILIGADSPQMHPEVFQAAALAILDSESNRAQFAFGPSMDGGFYLFGGRCPIPEEYWTRINYSVDSTASELKKSFSTLGSFSELEPLVDVDTVKDLALLERALSDSDRLTAGQETLLRWTRESLRSTS